MLAARATTKTTGMTKRDFFIVLIKVFGLYLIIVTVFSTLPYNIMLATGIGYVGVIWIIAAILIVAGLLFLLLTQAGRISDILNLEKGFDEERIDFSGLKNLDLIKFVLLLIGGFLFLENLPVFLSDTLLIFKAFVPKGFDSAYENQGTLRYDRLEDYTHWISSGFNLLVGYLLISNFKKISQYLHEKTSK